MRPQAHVAASLAIWSAARAPLWEAPIDVVAGNLPDFDRNVAKKLGVERRAHHYWVSHSFIGWFPPTVIALAAARDTRAEATVERVVLAVWVHLLLDTWADGIVWLWPVHKEKLGLFLKPADVKDQGWKTPAPRGSLMRRTEMAMWAAAAAGLVRRRRR